MKKSILFTENVPHAGRDLFLRMTNEKYIVYPIDCINWEPRKIIDYLSVFTKEDRKNSIIYLKKIDRASEDFYLFLLNLIEHDHFNVVAMAEFNNPAILINSVPMHVKAKFVCVNEINIVLKFLAHHFKIKS